MVKKIGKKILLATSVIITSALGFVFTSSKNADMDPTDSLLQQPIFAVETAHADGAGGDCCCGCDTSGGGEWVPPTPTSASVYVDLRIVP